MAKKKFMTATEFAKASGVFRQTVSAWLKRGIVPDAEEVTDKHGTYWNIPESALKTIDTWRPTRGRRKGATKDNGYKPK
jgi:hypothetical protein